MELPYQNTKNKMDGLLLLDKLPAGCISAAFFDPQYRGVLDKLSYGNEGVSRGRQRSSLPQMTGETIKRFIRGIERSLKPSGHLFLWVDKFHLCEGTGEWTEGTGLHIVDLITWDKGKIGMGYRTRRKCEYLLVLQKEPIRAKGCWNIHNIPDVWPEKALKIHPHSKPAGLQEALITATTAPGDFILDPAAGGYSVLGACEKTNRNFVGCDICFGNEQEDKGFGGDTD